MFEPLKGVRVIDLSQVLAGPYATYLLALMGAEVIKIEKPGEGDWTRKGPGVPQLSAEGMGVGYLTQNAQKKSVALDLKSDEGCEALRRLCKTADVFLENFKPGVAGRLGFDFEAVQQLSPSVVYCSVSAFGQDGPLSKRPAYDHIIQGMCGIMKTTGAIGAGPQKVGAPYVDYATGMNAAMAVLAGIIAARQTGKAQHLDVAMLDTSLMMMASLMTMHLNTGWIPSQSGNEAWSQSPSSGAFETSDGLLMLAANNEKQLRAMCSAIGREDILTDERWNTPKKFRENAADLRETLVKTFLTRTAAEWEDLLNNVAVPAGKVRGLEDVLAEEQVKDRGLIREVGCGDGQPGLQLPSLGFKANGVAPSPNQAPPKLGQHTAEVLTEIGYSHQEMTNLTDGTEASV